MNKLIGKVAIVTGASLRIGAAVAKALAEAGAAVAVNYSSTKEGAERIVSQITREGGKAIAIQADVSKAADVRRMFEETKKAFGSVDVLVNNAGVFQFDPLEAITEKEFHREFDINVLGTILATQEALKYFPRRGGSVINISSIAASENPVPNSCLRRHQGRNQYDHDGALEGIQDREISGSTPSAPGLIDTEGDRRSGFVHLPRRVLRERQLLRWARGSASPRRSRR